MLGLSTIQATNAVIALILSLAGIAGGVWLWFRNHVRDVASEVDSVSAAAAASSSADIARRLASLEGDMGRMGQELTNARGDLGRLNDRVVGVERVMEGVARASDVAALRADLAELRGALSERTAAMAGVLDTLYQAALRARQD